MNIVKRDHTVQPFDVKKIEDAIVKSFDGANVELKDVNFPSRVATEIREFYISKGLPSIDLEDVQDEVEKRLMEAGHFPVAKHYILYRNKRKEDRVVRGKKRNFVKREVPFGPIGYITYKRTYARKKENGETEEFYDTVMRVIKACDDQLHVGFTDKEEQELYEYLMDLKCSVAGRFLWQLGTRTVADLGLTSLQNCAAVVIDDPVKPFVFIFDLLMTGCGCGFSISKEHVDKLPPVSNNVIKIERIDRNDSDFIIPDCRRGWIKLLEEVLTAYFYKGKGFSYSSILVRTKGAEIKGFGGVASGPEELCKGMSQICGILDKRRGQKLRPIDCMDICCIVGTIVVSGNVRRSSLICIGDYDDIEFLNAKNWGLGNIPNWRNMSNNSVICDDTSKLPQEFWNLYMGNAEPYGLINLELSRKIGRIKDSAKYPDPDVICYNPCGEQSLANKETCCLAEIFLPNISNYDELKKIAVYLYRICKHSLKIKCHIEETEDIVHKNYRMGISVSGYLQATEIQRNWLSNLYEYLREYDKSYSMIHNMPTSIKLTTVKPSGTLSLLAGVTAGCHPALYRYYIRRIRISSNHPLIDVCRSHGYHIEYQLNFDKTEDRTTCVVSFPCKTVEHATLAEEMTAIKELEVVKDLQTNWSDNSVSCSIYYTTKELDEIKQWLLENYKDNVKTVSFMLRYDHGFTQAPYESISKDQYEEMIGKVRPIKSGLAQELEIDYSSECKGGMCPIR